ncbi:hypothetical protein HZC09_05940 [Candidatus Micrarchaeota archaeon]|nr:hypothetical protein [Candidatus Micrarchaeota archaeon]
MDNLFEQARKHVAERLIEARRERETYSWPLRLGEVFKLILHRLALSPTAIDDESLILRHLIGTKEKSVFERYADTLEKEKETLGRKKILEENADLLEEKGGQTVHGGLLFNSLRNIENHYLEEKGDKNKNERELAVLERLRNEISGKKGRERNRHVAARVAGWMEASNRILDSLEKERMLTREQEKGTDYESWIRVNGANSMRMKLRFR